MAKIKKTNFSEKEYQQELEARQRLDILQESSVNRNSRSRSITVGNGGSGTIEISLRAVNGNFIYHLLQPVEVTELIHSLSAQIGCHVHLKSRDDFASWREWRVSKAEKKHLNGHPPFCSDLELAKNQGTEKFDQINSEKALDLALSQEEYRYVNGGAVNTTFDGEVENVAIKKTVKQRKSK